MIRFRCPGCKKILSVKIELAGKRAACPGCKASFVIPTPKAAPAPPPKPAGETPTPRPAGETPTPRPAGETPTPRPAGETPTPRPAGETPTPRPAGETPTLRPAGETPAPRPVGETPAPRPSRPPQSAPVAKPHGDVENLAADLLAGAEKAEKAAAPGQKVDMTCPYCIEEIQFDAELAGKQAPCPECRRIIKVDQPKQQQDLPQNWRENNQQGPQFTKDNVEEKLDGVMSTADRTTVRRSSLEEAGALPDTREPVSVWTWVRRLVVLLVLLGLGVGGYFFVTNWRVESGREQAFAKAETKFEKVKKDMPPAWIGAYHRARGVYFTQKLMPEKAQRAFYATQILRSGQGGNGAPTPEMEWLLMEIALAQVDLGGTQDEVDVEEKFSWQIVFRDIDRTLSLIPTEEAKALALRRVCLRLVQKDQAGTALSLARKQAPVIKQVDAGSVLAAQQIAMFHVLKQPREATKLFPIPKGGPINEATRLGYAQGKAHDKDFSAATQMALYPGIALHRVKALLAVADVAFQQNNPDAAKSRLIDAERLADGSMKRRGLPPFVMYQLAEAWARLQDFDKAEAWVKTITQFEKQSRFARDRDYGLKALAKYVVMRHKSKVTGETFDYKSIPWKKSLGYALAVEYTICQDASALNVALSTNEELLQPLLHMAHALGAE